MKKSILLPFIVAFLFSTYIGIGMVQAAPTIVDFELEVELKDNTKFDIEYEVKGNTFEAKYQVPGKPVLYGQDAKVEVDKILSQLSITPDVDKNALKAQTLSLLKVYPSNVSDYELEVKFDTGQKLEIER
ncbi:YusW family protein [Alkalihalobacterium alkalinitrilicum]|uniref:YusW family protein n=1 Tax=Alkalihalobacterium alkalinitrilicum TaxID=427920 RepID=UPI0009958D94|nr:YusW family protein [Alkalihalobacterium alkalinitrilicum]